MSSVHAVSSTVIKGVPDDKIPDPIKKGLINSIFKGQSITDSFINNLMSGSFLNFERYYQYGKDHYIHGLPSGKIFLDNPGGAIAKAIIEAQIGFAITIDYFFLEPMNHTHYGWLTLINNLGYEEETNNIQSLTAANGFDTFLEQIVPIYSQDLIDKDLNRTFKVWGSSPAGGYTPERRSRYDYLINSRPPITVDYEIGVDDTEKVAIDWMYVDGTGDTVRGRIIYVVPNVGNELMFYQVKYYYDDAGTIKPGYWTYQYGLGTHPTLDVQREPDRSGDGTFFPFVFFRYDRVNRTAPAYQNTPEYDSTKKLLKILGIDYQQMGDDIHDEANTEINIVEQAVLVMAIPMNSTKPVELRYLYDFFDKLHLNNLAEGYEPPLILDDTLLKTYAISDVDFKVEFRYAHTHKKLKAGIIGLPNTYSSEATVTTMQKAFYYPRPGRPFVLNKVIKDVPVTTWHYRKQVSYTTYQEIRILAPSVYYDIWKDLGYIAPAESDELLIFIDREIVKNYPAFDREELYFRSLHYVMNAKKTEKLAWYESSIFRLVVLFAAIVITVNSFGASSPITGTVLTAGGLTIGALAIYVLETLVVSVIASQAAKIVIKNIGLENAFIAAILLLVTAYFTRDNSLLSMPSVSEAMVFISSNIINGFGGAIELEMEKLVAGFTELESDINKAEEQIAKALKLLDNPNELLDPSVFVRTGPIFFAHETPTTFYNRTIHAGNVGVLAFDAIEKFVENSLTLPTIDNSFGGKF